MTTRVSLRLLSIWFACCSLHAALIASAPAQEVEWRLDYTKACQEAEKKNRPLVIDVGTENCYWCKQLDLRTFKDPALVAFLNERCIPLKINAEQHPQLIERLHVQNYPTLVFASPERKILGYQEGFIEAAALRERLGTLFTPATTPATNPATNDVAANRDLQEATRAVATGDYPRAIALLKSVVENDKDQPVRDQARQLLQDLEQKAAGRCEEARQLVQNGKMTQAVEAVTELVRVYPGTQAAREGGQLLVTLASRVVPRENSRGRLARDLLDQAREDYRQQHYLTCLEYCENLTAHYADLPEGAEAGKLAAEIKDNPEHTKQVCDQMGERLSLLYLNLAETWLKKGQPQQAIFYLERVVQTFPNTRNADIAQVRLAQIQGPTRMPELRK